MAVTGNLAYAESADGIRGHVGVDGVGGIGIYELIGGSVRVEQPISDTSALIARAGHLQIRHIENETRELYPIFFGHGGYRRYLDWFYFAFEGGVIVGSDYRGVAARPSGAVSLGGKSTSSRIDAGLSFLTFPGLGFSICAHLGIDFVSW